MRCRLELIDDAEAKALGVGSALVVRDDTDAVVAFVVPSTPADRDPGRPPLPGVTVVSRDWMQIAEISTSANVKNPMEYAALAAVFYAARHGVPKDAKKDSDPLRVERRLATLLADIVDVVRTGLLDCPNVRAETTQVLVDLLVQLDNIRCSARFGSFVHYADCPREWVSAGADVEGGRAVQEPYFAGTAGGPRMSFVEAAEHYGMQELRARFPGVEDRTLRALLSWPIDLLRELLDLARAFSRRERDGAAGAPVVAARPAGAPARPVLTA